MKLLLIYVMTEKADFDMPPLGLGYLASYLFKHYKGKIDIKIIQKNYKQALEIISEYMPDIVGITSVSKIYNIVKKVAAFSKSKGILTIVGGAHVTCVPESLDNSIDIGVIREGEETLLEIINNFDEIKSHKKKLSEIKGIVYWNKDKLVINEPRDFIKNLDDVPIPARHLLDINPYHTIQLFTTRGCPYDCRFCANAIISKCRMRMFSVEHVINELKEVIEKYHPYYIRIRDDTFIANRERLKKIANAIIENGINKKVRFIVNARADLIDDEMVKILKSMNTYEISIGYESGSEKILRYLKCNSTTVRQNENAVKTIKKFGIKATGFFIIGAPMDTKETILETLNFIKKNPLDIANVFILTPYPGTEIWDYALKRGLVSENMDLGEVFAKDINADNRYDSSVYLCENLPKKEFDKLRKKFLINNRIMRFKYFFVAAFSSPARIVPYIRKTVAEIISSLTFPFQ